MVERRVLRNDVERMIREQLLESRRQPGARIGIDGLARELEVSPTPVREAMVSLEQSGLVEYTALKGYVVAPHLTPEQIRDLVDARSVVEPAALSRAFARWGSLLEDLEAAQAAHEEILTRIRDSSEVDFALVREHFQADWGFHNTILRMAGNRYLQSMADGLGHHTHRMRQTWEGGVTDIDAEQAV
ncbi:MAG: GntR family transcriptional regulator, partial [Brachybacterium sp.]|nr:GntR family transcriptional regulator [Brachybacterium sp.]